MTNLVKYAAGAFPSASPGAWGTSAQSGFSTADLALFNTLANGSCVVASTAVPFGTLRDLYCQVEVSLVGSATSTPSSIAIVGVLPLNSDGSTYGDQTPSGAAQSVVPGDAFKRGLVNFRSGVSAGGTLLGKTRIFESPQEDSKIWVAVFLGNATAGSAAASVRLRTFALTNNG